MKHQNSSFCKWTNQSGKSLSKQLGVSRLLGRRASIPGPGFQNQHFVNTLLYCCSGALTIIYQAVVRTHVFAETPRLMEASALDSRALSGEANCRWEKFQELRVKNKLQVATWKFTTMSGNIYIVTGVVF